jgi:hypothetical protein
MKKITTLLFFIFLLVSFSLTAQTLVWDGGGDGSTWSNANNWNPDQVPAADDYVEIKNATVNISIGNAVAAAVLIGPGGNLNILSGAELSISDPGNIQEEPGIEILVINGAPAALNNDGTITVSDVEDQGIVLRGNTTAINNGTIYISNTRDDDGIEIGNFLGPTYFENNGAIYTANTYDSGFNVSTSNSNLDNHFVNNGDLYIENSSEDSGLTSRGRNGIITNNGLVVLNGQYGEYPVEAFQGGVIENNLLIEINGTSLNEDYAIRIIQDSRLFNFACGVINVNSQFPCNVNTSNFGPNIPLNMVNEGIFATAYTGLDNIGEIDNTGELRTPSGTAAGFNVTGAGAITDGRIPARFSLANGCPPFPPAFAIVPTMGQWGFFLFGLVVYVLGVVSVYNVRKSVRHKA